MTLSKSPGAYSDCYAAMDAAITDELGVRLLVADTDTAIFFRMRCHQARKIDREKNAMTYESDHPLHSSSIYDQLVLKIEKDAEGTWLILEKNNVIPGTIVSLSTGEEVEAALPSRAPVPKVPEPAVDIGAAFDEMPTVADEPKAGIRRL